MTNEKMVEELAAADALRTPAIIEAFLHVNRSDFVPENMKEKAFLNIPLPIGFGQTISQPLTVAFLLELLQPQYGDIVLDVGSGSGWQAALLAHIVSNGGKDSSERKGSGCVICLERIPELARQCRQNIAAYNYLKRGVAQVHTMSAADGYLKAAPFDRIISAASAATVPRAWRNQLRMGGRIVAPIRSSVVRLEKQDRGAWREESFPGFVFVPFVP